jgi:hypothetical protein
MKCKETCVRRTQFPVPDSGVHGAHARTHTPPDSVAWNCCCIISERAEEGREVSVLRSSAVAWDGHMGWGGGALEVVLCAEQAAVWSQQPEVVTGYSIPPRAAVPSCACARLKALGGRVIENNVEANGRGLI